MESLWWRMHTKYKHFILIFLAIGLFISAKSNNLFKKDGLGDLFKSIVKIRIDTTQKLSVDSAGLVEFKTNYATGFYVTEYGLILTAAHAMEKQSKLQSDSIICTELVSLDEFAAIPLIIDTKNDLALLLRPRGNKINHFINISNLKINDAKTDCYCIGVPNELHKSNKIFAISYGKILSFSKNLRGSNKMPYRKNLIFTNCEVISGFSGGLILDANLSPIGLILGALEEKRKTFCFGKSFKYVRKLVNEYEESIK